MTFDDIRPYSTEGNNYGYVYDPEQYYSSSPQTRANYGMRGGAEEGTSNVITGVGGALSSVFPAVGAFMGVGKAAYSGIKSTNSEAGDFFSHFFGPHHTFMGYFDDSRMPGKTAKERKQDIGSGLLSLFLPGSGAFLSIGRGREKRKEAKLNELKLKNGAMASQRQPSQTNLQWVADVGNTIGSFGLGNLVGKGTSKIPTGADASVEANPTAPQQYEGQQTIDVQSNDYWNSLWGGNEGGGVTGLMDTPRNYETAPQVDNTTVNPYGQGYMRKGGKVEGGTHEEGGVALVDVKTGKDTGIRVEGKERVVNETDWAKVLGLLDDGESKKALKILKAIDKRKPEKEYEDGGTLNLPSSGNWDSFGILTEEYPYQNAPDIQENYIIKTPLATEAQTITEQPTKQGGFDWQSALGYGFDLTKLGLGMEGAMKKLPEWQVPQEWNQYMDRARYFSELGLTPEEKAAYNDQTQMDYASLVRDLTNASGGTSGALLGSLVAANLGRYRNAAKLATTDRRLKQDSFDRFRDTLLKDIDLKKGVFDIEYANTLRDKTAGAQLMQDSLYNLENRIDTDKNYGKNSAYGKYMQALYDKGASDAEIAKKQKEWWSNPENIKGLYATTGGGKTVPNADKEGAPSTKWWEDFIKTYNAIPQPY